jgi:hypothetical protein
MWPLQQLDPGGLPVQHHLAVETSAAVVANAFVVRAAAAAAVLADAFLLCLDCNAVSASAVHVDECVSKPALTNLPKPLWVFVCLS